MSDAAQVSGYWRGQFQVEIWAGRIGWEWRNWERAGQPVEGFSKAEIVQMDDQIDGTAPAHPTVPVDELGPGDRENSLRGVPLALVVGIGLGAAKLEHRGQRDAAQLVSPFADRREVHRQN